MTKKLKIAMLCFAHPVDDGRVAFREAVALKKAGYRVRIIGRAGKSGIIGGQRVYGIPALAISRRYMRNMILRVFLEPFSFVRFFFICSKYSKRADVLHCHEYQSLLIALILKKFRRQIVVYDCHEFQPELFAESFFACSSVLYRLSCGIFSFAERMLAKRCDGVISVNDFLVGRFRSLCDTVCLLPNFPSKRVLRECDLFNPKVDELKKVIHNKTVIAFLGGLSVDRGVLRILEALKIITEHRDDVFFVAYGRMEDEDFWTKHVDEMGLNDFVAFTGAFKSDEYLTLLAVADIGLYLPDPASWHINRSCATKVFQYCSAGIPALLADNPAHRMLLRQADFALLVDAVNLEDIVRQIELLVDNIELRKSMGNSAKKVFSECWNAEAVEQNLICFYENLVEGDKGE